VNLEYDFEKRYRLVREIIETIVLTVLMFLVIRLAVQNFNIDGMSMEPNFHNRELVLVDKWSYLFHPPNRGDVVVFVAPPTPTQDYIKRVIGVPGDVISVVGTKVVVNGKTLNETYVSPANQGNPYVPLVNVLIPPNEYFVLGDNRAGSYDSRAWGCVPSANLIGRASLIYWPLGQDNDGLPHSVSSIFQSIPSPPANAASDTPCTVTHAVPATGKIDSSLVLQGQNSTDPTSSFFLLVPNLFVAHVTGRKRKSLLS
jgi:signal peptidase I